MKIAILGYGTVGRGVDRIVKGLDDIEVTRILELPDRCEGPRMTSDYTKIVDDPQIEAVLECMGGLEPAHTFIMQALQAGKSVVTSNKAVVAAYFDEFARTADEHGASLLIEATCGGGIPWIASIEKVRRIDEVSCLSGIMNGTTNFIVDAMIKNGADFAETLARAQELGYAEADPSADIDGIDVKNKTRIAVGVAFDTACVEDIPVTGIRTITKADLDLFAAHGRTVKLLGRAVQWEGRYAASVEPVALPSRSLEANVPSNFNIVSLEGATVGPLKFYGQGAGSLPTGNAMVQDVIDLAAGRRPKYDFSRGLAYDPALLAGDYVLRTAMPMPQGAEPYDQGAWLVRDIDPVAARALFDDALAADPTSFMAHVPQED
ncbi:MAG: homoserine dehydrogenase [Atopobiaceae bacterium]|nr:homoserine dehydrogenase [Atopobiaceae bacterium]